MGIMKTFGFAVLISGVSMGAARGEQTLLNRVTECVGRFSAQMEHHWMFADLPNDQVERHRANLIDILETLMTPETASRTLSARIDAKMAHAALLSQAAFAKDDRTAA